MKKDLFNRIFDSETVMMGYAATVAIRCGFQPDENIARGRAMDEAAAIAVIRSRATAAEATYYAPRVGAVADAEFIRVFCGLINW